MKNKNISGKLATLIEVIALLILTFNVPKNFVTMIDFIKWVTIYFALIVDLIFNKL